MKDMERKARRKHVRPTAARLWIIKFPEPSVSTHIGLELFTRDHCCLALVHTVKDPSDGSRVLTATVTLKQRHRKTWLIKALAHIKGDCTVEKQSIANDEAKAQAKRTYTVSSKSNMTWDDFCMGLSKEQPLQQGLTPCKRYNISWKDIKELRRRLEGFNQHMGKLGL